ncbi:MAG TPA: DUF805 domain-containing protein [Bryocella sp.]|nr:DUF805 domain-containing protein [Bryocella sp.]
MYWYLEVMRNYAVFAGRARRTEYWMFCLVNMLIGVIAGVFLVFAIPTMSRGRNPFAILIGVLLIAYVLATLVPGLAVSVRRLHDTNLSGWWLLIGFIPLGGLVLFVFHLLDSTPGPNRYGPNPKGVGMAPYAAQNAAYGSHAMSAAAAAGGGQTNSRWLLGFCNSCGTQIQAGARFCPNCGKAAH